jgi:hypothetical protein
MTFHETIAADETARFERFASEIVEIQRARIQKGGPIARALHLKPHIGAVGELVVDAPEAGRVGVFASNGQRWPLYVRFSNGSSGRQPDKAPDVRGVALKLVGVPGKKIIPGLEQELTQDFLFIDQPAIAFRNPDEFMTFVRAAKDGPVKLLPASHRWFWRAPDVPDPRPDVEGAQGHVFRDQCVPHVGADLVRPGPRREARVVPGGQPAVVAGRRCRRASRRSDGAAQERAADLGAARAAVPG